MLGGTTLRGGALALALLLVAAVPVRATAAPGAPSGPAGKASALSPRLAGLADVPQGPQARTLSPGTQAVEARQDALVNRAPDGRPYVDLRVDDPDAVAQAAALPGASVEATAPDGLAATLAVPVEQLGALAELTGVRSAHEVPRPLVQRVERPAGPPAVTAATTCPSGTTVSSGSAQLGVPLARSTFGVDGTGVTIGIISDSFGVNETATAKEVAAGNLPGAGNPCGHTTPVQRVTDVASGTDEGRAMAQIVHDLAPGATLLFADMGSSQLEMANHIRALRDAGAQVIVDDIIYPDETMYQDGWVAAAVDEVAADGVAYFSSAGNGHLTAGGKPVGSYEAQGFRSAACPAAVTDSTCHDFDPGSGVTTTNVIELPANGDLLVTLGWNEPTYGVGTDLDLFVLDDATGAILTAGAADNLRYGQPIEWAAYDNPSTRSKKVRVVVASYGGTGTPRFKLILHSSTLSAVQWNTSVGGDVVGPTLSGHAAAAGGFAVGAMTDQVAPAVEAYSSRGPATSCWEPSRGSQASAALPACTTRTVGTLGTDGVATTVPGFNPFFGTSAAAPHVAAVAALMRQHAPCSTPAAIHDALRAGAVPLGSEPDASGAGRTDAVGAIEELAACPVTLPAPRFPWLGRVKADRVTMSLYTPDSVVGEPTNYRLQVLRPGGSVVTTHELPVTNGERYLGPEVLLTPGTAYRFRVQVDVGGQTTPWSPPSPLVIQPFRSLSVFLNQLATDLTVDGFTGEERELIGFLVEADYSPGFAALTASQVKNWGPMIDPVTRLYYAYFGRKPDPSGLEHWLQRRRAGVLLDQISGTFAASSEFTRKYGSLTNRAFVELVYRNVLGRAGDPGGITYWTRQLDTKKRKRGQVMTGFSESNEHLRKRRGEVVAVNLTYGLLRRIPTTAELTTWVPQIGSPDRIAGDRAAEALAQTIFTSLEYIDRVS